MHSLGKATVYGRLVLFSAQVLYVYVTGGMCGWWDEWLIGFTQEKQLPKMSLEWVPVGWEEAQIVVIKHLFIG